MQVKPGSRWRSAVCEAEVVVIKPAREEILLECGGREMLPAGVGLGDLQSAVDGFDNGAQLGKRYEDEATGLEVLCNKAGLGSLGASGRELTMKKAKKLPSSD